MDDAHLFACSIQYLLKRIQKRQTVPRVFDESLLKRYRKGDPFNTKVALAPTRAASFVCKIVIKSRMCSSVFICALIYLSRLVQKGYQFTPCTWRPMLSVAVLLADKMWLDARNGLLYDEPHNGRITTLFPQVSNPELRKMEYVFLEAINWRLNVDAEQFTTFSEKLKEIAPSEKVLAAVDSWKPRKCSVPASIVQLRSREALVNVL
eukprot:GEMP01061043.1.p1 GENE.GEMP01061043.1~~GEMP01061043.1.p1  ORF type:complete len:217 (+),score=29.77 GEMP01061043.1:32-652(+)